MLCPDPHLHANPQALNSRQDKVGMNKFKPLRQPGGNGFIAGHRKTGRRRALVILRGWRGMMLMSADGMFVKQTEPNCNPAGNHRRGIKFAIDAFAR